LHKSTAIVYRQLKYQKRKFMLERAIEEYTVTEEPLSRHEKRDRTLEAAYAARLPVMLKGPTGCGKTRFVEHMAWRLNRPLITVACHEDLSATDLVGRFLRRRRNHLARRPANCGGEKRRDLLSR
jgi:MoxR-like ATPase